MATLFILVTPCIALTAPLISPAISAFAVLLLALILSMLMTALFVQTWIMGDYDETEAVVEDAFRLESAVFASLARDPAASSAPLSAESNVVVHRQSTAPNRGYELGNETGWVEGGLRIQDNMWTDEEELGSWPEHARAWHARAWGKQSLSSSSGTTKRHAALRGLRGLWLAVQSLESSDKISLMV